MGKVLLTGGTGYIGSHTAVDLLSKGYEVFIVDNLSNSRKTVLSAIEEITGKRPEFLECDLSENESVEAVGKMFPDMDAIIHFAAYKSVEISCREPLSYFRNNINSTLNAIEIARRSHADRFVFSSSCTVYGNAEKLPVTEETPFKETESPYASTKVMGEQILRDFVRHTAACSGILLRYFNPAGAHQSALIGESSLQPPTNLVPIITETAIGKREEMTIFGSDYETRDGTCLRDYIHVVDLARAHTLALEYPIAEKARLDIFNLGTGSGVTVKEAVEAFEKCAGIDLNYKYGERRAGDVVSIYADYRKAKEVLKWEPEHDISDIMKTAWEWEKRRSNK